MSNLKEDPMMHLIGAMLGEDPSKQIQDQEKRGQTKLVQSELIPTELMHGVTEQDLIDDGFELGDVREDDPIFREAKLPEGWKKQPTNHSMWSEIVDQDGFSCYRVFYKAAFYDRHAHISKTNYKQDFKPGQRVIYYPNHGAEEKGEIVRQSDDPRLWFVLYDGDTGPKATKGCELGNDYEAERAKEESNVG